MKKITPSNITKFAPSYPPQKQRNRTHDPNAMESLYAPLIDWNKESAIGLEEPELDMLGLMLIGDRDNTRFNNNKFVHAALGGSHAEHPVFIGHRIDTVRDKAGYGPENFSAQDKAHRFAAASLSQKLHAMAAVHGAGELVDISYAEQEMLGILHKTPLAEWPMAQFKLKLAAHALSDSNPSLYLTIIAQSREQMRVKKEFLIEQMLNGELSRDNFIAEYGGELQSIIDSSARLDLFRKPPLSVYKKALKNLSALYEETQRSGGFEDALFQLMNALESDAGFRHYIGKTPEHSQHGRTMLQRLFDDGKTLSFEMASSRRVLMTIQRSQNKIMPMLQALEAMPDGVGKEVAGRFARAAIGELLRNDIRLLQKSPPLIDLSGADNTSAANSYEPARQQKEFDRRFEVQKNLSKHLPAGESRYPLQKIEGAIDTKTLIALFDKAATAIEQGSFLPTGETLPIGRPGILPAALHVTFEDVKSCARKYPLAVSTAYQGTGISLR